MDNLKKIQQISKELNLNFSEATLKKAMELIEDGISIENLVLILYEIRNKYE